MSRSATSPMPRAHRPPSPDLPPNMDCAFPPFPTSGNAALKSARLRPKERSASNYQPSYAGAEPLYAPLSPRTNGGENVAKRMDTIAPGPFDGRGGDRRPSTSDGRRTPGQKEPENPLERTTTLSSTRSSSFSTDHSPSLTSSVTPSSASIYSSDLPALLRPGNGAMGPRSPPLPPAPPKPEPESEGIDAFLNRLQKETSRPSLSQDSRSRTFPLRQGSRDTAEAPPRPRRPSESNSLAPRPTDIDPANPPRSRDLVSVQNASPHTPSDSGISDDSLSSGGLRSASSSLSSPPSSEASGQHSRDVSKLGRTEYTNGEPIPRAESPESFTDPRTPPKPERRERMGYDRGNAPEPLSQSSSDPFPAGLESPLDPAIQHGRYMNRIDNNLIAERSSPQAQPETRPLPDRRPTGTSKGNCRGCSGPIIGKSVKDSSGRLTGRYHKQCFVCRTCQSTFPSAEFYVFDNSPYCEHHYHELNGSLCTACNRGIEGQYLETDQRRKFHPRCFSCLTCRVILRDDYYEVEGKPYCERHAYAVQKSIIALAPGNNHLLSNKLQKRSTRLMMMM